MTKLWQRVLKVMPIAAIMLLCIFAVPAAQANGNGNSNGNATAQQQSVQQSSAIAVNSEDQKAKPKAKVAAKPRDKSVLDAEVLASPIAYFKNAFTAEEDESEATPSSGAVVITVKALIATLLSTIM